MGPKQTELVSLDVSPFTKRAKWALDYSGIDYKTSPYPTSTLYLFELPLRLRLKRLTGRITSPILFPAKGAPAEGYIMDSTGIARWADQHGSKPGTLFPAGASDQVDRWAAAADETLSYFRRGVVDLATRDPSFQAKMLPPPSSGLLGLLQKLLGWFMLGRALRKMLFKYPEDERATQEQVSSSLQGARQALAASGSGYLLRQGFTYADMALVTALDMLRPSGCFRPVGPAALSASMPSMQQLAGQFEDLFQYRDRVLQQQGLMKRRE